MNSASDDLKSLFKFLIVYQHKKTKVVASAFEKVKNKTVSLLMHRRGKFQKHFFHSSMIGLAGLGLVSSGILGGGDSLISKTFPYVSAADPRLVQTFDPNTQDSVLNSLIDFKTSVSEKPRSEIIDYTVRNGETISQIADKFTIDVNTIKWANDLTDIHTVKPGQVLKILPVSGVAHTVKNGDTLEGVAKKYQAESQAILDYPFNDLPDDFKLKIGQVLIVPEGQPPEVKTPPRSRLQPQFLASGPSNTYSAPGGGSFIWPTSTSGISQYFAWYHPGVDMPNKSAPPINASDGGTVIVAGWPDNWGYGNRVVIDHGNGYQTLYAHLSNIYVTSGSKVSRGQTVGQMGSTGRSTGTHLHFEIRYKGIAVNPLAILK